MYLVAYETYKKIYRKPSTLFSNSSTEGAGERLPSAWYGS
jgi:hypothetical protein